jgi:hypothetical protein
MALEEKRQHKREHVPENELLSIILLDNAKSYFCNLIDISNGGIQIRCKQDCQLKNKAVDCVLRNKHENHKNDGTTSFKVEIMWHKTLKDKEALLGLKYHLIDSGTVARIYELIK